MSRYRHLAIYRRVLATAVFAAAAVLLAEIASGWSASQASSQESYTHQRSRMVEEQIIGRGVRDRRVISALREVPRHLFVPAAVARLAYEDHPLPIGYGQTISQPYMVGFMTELLSLRPQDRVLEIGTGSGYQAAILSRLVTEVYSIEIVAALAATARERLERLGYRNVQVKTGDGYQGWPEFAPFDTIVVTAAPPEVPAALVAQLARGGRLVIPVGPTSETQNLLLIEKSRDSEQIVKRTMLPVRFVPMVKVPIVSQN